MATLPQGPQPRQTLNFEIAAIGEANYFALITMGAILVSIFDLAFGTGLLGISASTVGIVVDTAAVYFLWGGFRELLEVDPGNFSVSARLTTASLVGLPMILAGLILLFQSDDPNRSLGGLAILGIGAVLALSGLFGEVLGLWRIGQRYSNSRVRVGSLLFFIPVVGLIGSVLLLMGIRHIRGRLVLKGRP